VIVSTEQLPEYRGRVSMVDGGFDPLHAGHIDYFEAAAGLGVPVLCNVASDAYVSKKHAPLLSEQQRIRILDAIRYLDLVHLSGTTTAEILGILRPRYYVKGSDWEDKLPQEELDVCSRFGVEIVYLDTVTQSSTELLSEYGRSLG
jgi:cytidyltransferase-like protein